MAEEGSKKLEIQQGQKCHLERIMELYARARKFMAEHGNPTQWPPTYPPRDLVERNIQEGHVFVCMAEGRIVAVFYYRIGEDPTYQVIKDGNWLNDGEYGVVHRITSDGSVRGAASFCLQWAWEQCGNLRIDTHRDNVVMQNLLKKNGFEYCGIIYVNNGEERLAYQKGPRGMKERT